MSEQTVCAELSDRVLSEVRQICSMSNPGPDLLARAARLTDLVHNIPRWLVGPGVRGKSLFDLLEEFARYTGYEELVADAFEGAGNHGRGRPRIAFPHGM